MSDVKKIVSKKDLQAIKDAYLKEMQPYEYSVLVCGGAGCVSSHCAEVEDALRVALTDLNLNEKVRVVVTGCVGFCAIGPILIVEPGGVLYSKVTPEAVRSIVEKHIINGEVAIEHTYFDAAAEKHIPKMKEIPFYTDQVRIALRNCGRISFSSLDEYIANDGYLAAADVLAGKDRQEIIQTLIDSGLRGRGGAGFPTGIKWQSGMIAQGEQKYLICNADEGDPGAFMDRSLLEGDPHSIIEAMLIGGYTIGASKGYVYVRAEYPLAVERLTVAIEQAREAGLLGKNIFGSDFSFELEIRIGAGAFVCGEETALISSIEGQRGEPRQKPPFPFQKGLFGCPTIIDNVETLANVPAIMLKGAEWYAAYGTGKSRGTKVFALAGDVMNTGIIEVPMGYTLRDVIYKIGGGIKNGEKFKAIQTGGPSGGCLTKDHLDVTLDYESLAAMGAIMGSGGLIVMDENTCMVDTARFFMDFVQDESCGHCLACRVGTKRMLEILENITNGKGTMEDLALLKDIAETVKDTAMCGLGQTAPNPVLTTLNYFYDEYVDHVENKHCVAHVCSSLTHYYIDPDKCRGCMLCAKKCPVGAISGERQKTHVIDQEKCIHCGICMASCRFDAVAYK